MDNIEKSNDKDTSNYTRQQIAQKAKVGLGTIARYDKVMNSDDEELKQKANHYRLLHSDLQNIYSAYYNKHIIANS